MQVLNLRSVRRHSLVPLPTGSLKDKTEEEVTKLSLELLGKVNACLGLTQSNFCPFRVTPSDISNNT